MKGIRNLIFDLDGTLIDSSKGVVEAVNYALRETVNAEQPAEVIKPWIGSPLEAMFADFTDTPYDRLFSLFREQAARSMVDGTLALDGATEVLKSVKADGYNLAIATTKIQRHINGIIDKFGWRPFFSVTAGADEVKEVKPNPEILYLVLERMKATSAETLFIGDTTNDILAARAVPIGVVAVASEFGDREKVLASGPDHYISSIRELPALLRDGSGG